MAEFKWIHTSLFLMAILQFTDAGMSKIFLFHEDATLKCENMIKNQHKCLNTTWIFERTRREVALVELIQLRQISEAHRTKSDRLSLTENCSLLIKNLSAEDAGYYVCLQFNSRGRQQGPIAPIDLSVVTMTVEKKSDEVTLNCSVSTYPVCSHQVSWLNDGTEVKDEENLKISHRNCSTSLKILSSGVINKPKLESLSCQIKDGLSGDVKPFPFIRRASGVEPDEKPVGTDCSVVDYIMLVIRVVELLLVTVITVLLIRATVIKRPRDDSTELKQRKR